MTTCSYDRSPGFCELQYSILTAHPPRPTNIFRNPFFFLLLIIFSQQAQCGEEEEEGEGSPTRRSLYNGTLALYCYQHPGPSSFWPWPYHNCPVILRRWFSIAKKREREWIAIKTSHVHWPYIRGHISLILEARWWVKKVAMFSFGQKHAASCCSPLCKICY